ncbi:MAG: hypothetical protein Q8P18_33595 [Pseudomonadota bacterium]|nr:hypothetical protein [Pseudomonadota bacterium]
MSIPAPVYRTDAQRRASARVWRLGIVAVSLVVLAGFLRLVYAVNNPLPPDLTDRFLDVAPFIELSEVGAEGWVGRVDAAWPGLTDAAVADVACAALELRLRPAGNQTITILDAEGLPARECRGATDTRQ